MAPEPHEGLDGSSYNLAYDTGFKDGHDVGYDAGYDTGYHAGLKKGYLDGANQSGIAAAEEAVSGLLPEGHILPQYSAVELLRRGLESCKAEAIPLLSAREVADRIRQALKEKHGLSIVRLGDGEALVLAQDAVLDIERIRKRGPWLSYAGVEVPDLATREALKTSVLSAGIVGVPTPRLENHQPLLFHAFAALGIDWKRLTLTHAVINYMVHKEGYLRDAIDGARVLLVGNQAKALRSVLDKRGVKIAGAVGPVKGVGDIERVMRRVRQVSFDVAFVAAGIPAVILSQRIATEMDRVALDFGHLADELIQGQAAW